MNDAREVVILMLFTGSSFHNLGAAYVSEKMAPRFVA